MMNYKRLAPPHSSLIIPRSSLLFRRASREPEAEEAALVGAGFDCYCAAHRLGERERDGESEAGAAARVFRREEGVEDAREDFGRDAVAVVLDFDSHARAVERGRDPDA